MRKYERKPGFDATLSKLAPVRKTKARESIRKLVVFFETGERTAGLGLKKLQKDYWEIRTDLKDRILFRLKGDTVEFIIAGNHNEIKRYLKNV
ncbi:MAG: hypothetical protein QME81_00780 [bacterium]|nr:hypothetical protein [bacterium]